jgi:hypothetical protein
VRRAWTRPWAYPFTRNYQHVDDREARDRVLAEAAADMKAQNEAKQPRSDALMAKMQSLGQELGAAAQKGDYARDGRDQQGGREGHGRISKAQRRRRHDRKDECRSRRRFKGPGDERRGQTSTPRQKSLGEGAEALGLPPGAQSAFRWTEERDGLPTGHALVLLGDGNRKVKVDFRARHTPASRRRPRMRISVHVQADPSRLAATVDGIDFAKIASILPQ